MISKFYLFTKEIKTDAACSGEFVVEWRHREHAKRGIKYNNVAFSETDGRLGNLLTVLLVGAEQMKTIFEYELSKLPNCTTIETISMMKKSCITNKMREFRKQLKQILTIPKILSSKFSRYVQVSSKFQWCPLFQAVKKIIYVTNAIYVFRLDCSYSFFWYLQIQKYKMIISLLLCLFLIDINNASCGYRISN